MMDPAAESYRRHLVAMTKTVIEQTPNAGLCIDRQDMVGTINPGADDGVTLYQWRGAPSQPVAGRSTFFSFVETMEVLGGLLHANGMGTMINVHTTRVDMLRDVDGVFDEHGDNPSSNMKVTGLATIAKPAVIWNHGPLSPPCALPGSRSVAAVVVGRRYRLLVRSCSSLAWPRSAAGQSASDSFLQRHLLMGVNFMAPFVNNDHSIHYPLDDAIFVRYAPLFAQLRSKQWLLAAHAVFVQGNLAEARRAVRR